LYISLQSMSADGAVLVAGLIGFGLANSMDAASLDSWGWRAALMVGGLIVPFGLLLRRNLGETLHAKPQAPTAPVTGTRSYRQIVALSLAMLAAATTTNYILDYLTTYAGSTLGMPANLALGATAVVGLCGFVCDPISGWLSDRFGRKPVMIVPWIVLLLAIFPSFWLLANLRTGAALYGASVMLAMASTLSSATVLVTITESLPHHVRSGSLSLIYAISISIFGGSTQFMVNWLTHITGNTLAPAWYMVAGVAVGLTAILLMPETAPIKTGMLRGVACPAPE